MLSLYPLGFDTHASVESQLYNLFSELNGAFHAFSEEMKALNVWDNVTVIQTSDFARTLNPNGGAGTDHAWGGNYMLMGMFIITLNVFKHGQSTFLSHFFCYIFLICRRIRERRKGFRRVSR